MMKLSAMMLCALVLGAAWPVAAAPACTGGSLTLVSATDLQTRVFGALANEDRAAWVALATDDFVAHENGKAYDRDGFYELIANAHRSGTGLNWSVTRPSVESRCGLALLWYVNEGTVTRGGVAKPTRWLETSSFRQEAGKWRLFLVTSMVVKE